MPSKQSLLWQVHRNDVHVGYIFGSMHIGISGMHVFLPTVYKAIIECDYFATEIPLDGSIDQLMTQKLLLPNNSTLSQIIGEKRFEKYRSICLKSFQIDMNQFQRFYPIVIVNFVSQSILHTQPNESMLDQHLWSFAKEKDIDCIGIEDTEVHLAVLDHMTLDDQLIQLKHFFKNVNNTRKRLRKMHSLYFSQQIHSLYKASKKGLGTNKDKILYERNNHIVEKFLEFPTSNKVFAAIGAGHLSGKYGIIHFLKQNECRVSPVELLQD